MIEINLDEELDNTTSTYLTIQRRLVTEIVRIRNRYLMDNGFNATKLIVGSRIFNVINDAVAYSTAGYKLTDDSFDRPTLVGKLMGIDVYLYVEMDINLMRMSIDDDVIRDMKIESILNDVNIGDRFTIDIKVISSII
jgi:hypothetical protein